MLKKICVLKENNYISDNEIESQYEDMNIISFNLESLRNSEGYKGYFEIEFPNADDIDFDSYMINNFIVYDKNGNRIAWDNWMPDVITKKLENKIREKIKKQNITKINESDIRYLVKETVKRLLNELNKKDFNATKEDFWKKQHGYNKEDAERAAAYMEKHYGNLEEFSDDEIYDDYIDDEDNWMKDEPSEEDVNYILNMIKQECEKTNGSCIFKNLGDHEFGIIAKGGCTIPLYNLIHDLAEKGIIYNTGGGLSFTPSRVKFRIIGKIN